MSIKLLSLESGIAVGFGAVDAVVDTKGTTNWGAGALNQRWSLVLEVGGLLAAMFGSKVGLHSSEVTTPIGVASLTLLGRRAARYATAAGGVGNLFKPGQWAGMGGEGGDFVGGGNGGDSSILQLGAGGGKFDRIPGRGGYPLYPPTAEAPGIAG
jgi:hypothetical protein